MKREELLLKLLILAVCWMLVTYELSEGLSLPSNFLLVFCYMWKYMKVKGLRLESP